MACVTCSGTSSQFFFIEHELQWCYYSSSFFLASSQTAPCLLSSFDTHASWQPVTQRARSRRSHTEKKGTVNRLMLSSTFEPRASEIKYWSMLVLSTFLESKTVPNVVPFAGLILVQTSTTKDCKGPQTHTPKNVGSINTWSAKMISRHIKSASRILQCWSYYVKINSARHQHDSERT